MKGNQQLLPELKTTAGNVLMLEQAKASLHIMCNDLWAQNILQRDVPKKCLTPLQVFILVTAHE